MSETVKLTEEQEKEGYWVEQSGEYVLVWHRNKGHDREEEKRTEGS